MASALGVATPTSGPPALGCILTIFPGLAGAIANHSLASFSVQNGLSHWMLNEPKRGVVSRIRAMTDEIENLARDL